MSVRGGGAGGRGAGEPEPASTPFPTQPGSCSRGRCGRWHERGRAAPRRGGPCQARRGEGGWDARTLSAFAKQADGGAGFSPGPAPRAGGSGCGGHGLKAGCLWSGGGKEPRAPLLLAVATHPNPSLPVPSVMQGSGKSHVTPSAFSSPGLGAGTWDTVGHGGGCRWPGLRPWRLGGLSGGRPRGPGTAASDLLPGCGNAAAFKPA